MAPFPPNPGGYPGIPRDTRGQEAETGEVHVLRRLDPIVGVSASANSNQITSAYRKASLKVHPDRNPDDPLASEKFQALQTAFKILLDPIKRTEFDAKRATQAARTARFAGLDNKRKALARDLEAREEAKAAKIRKLEEINAAGAKLRQARMSELAAAIPTPSTQPAEPSPVQSTYPPAAPVETCNTLECTLRFKWTRKKLPDLNTVEDLST
ncbi:DnaJ subfamily B member 11 [Puccinia graminis f. sp. tritici CRL 75-36-700-3]|uniref:DnaJ subfamily B member 11 n=1 Tax=Puccinia graminis f. sp. tritici (strain CRL 75-36-700-3 / race SCCL) TaxID=418459 RepID=E3K2P9_PUCGT|nr:DnaJ subfamily B member 11 [Puccinia graminis f. sp. tritici CRL 75-36-700-3]EFP78618.1 DnaJ subfamily B member 11 [Puccinia graminis f. sp. tritici CRL 75-36-700-3]